MVAGPAAHTPPRDVAPFRHHLIALILGHVASCVGIRAVHGAVEGELEHLRKQARKCVAASASQQITQPCLSFLGLLGNHWVDMNDVVLDREAPERIKKFGFDCPPLESTEQTELFFAPHVLRSQLLLPRFIGDKWTQPNTHAHRLPVCHSQPGAAGPGAWATNETSATACCSVANLFGLPRCRPLLDSLSATEPSSKPCVVLLLCTLVPHAETATGSHARASVHDLHVNRNRMHRGLAEEGCAT